MAFKTSESPRDRLIKSNKRETENQNDIFFLTYVRKDPKNPQSDQLITHLMPLADPKPKNGQLRGSANMAEAYMVGSMDEAIDIFKRMGNNRYNRIMVLLPGSGNEKQLHEDVSKLHKEIPCLPCLNLTPYNPQDLGRDVVGNINTSNTIWKEVLGKIKNYDVLNPEEYNPPKPGVPIDNQLENS